MKDIMTETEIEIVEAESDEVDAGPTTILLYGPILDEQVAEA